MIKHIVSWRFSEADKLANLQRVKALLEKLPEVITEIQGLEVGLNILPGERAMDMVLITEFSDLAALESYRVHPEHQKVVEAIKEVTVQAVSVDFESNP